MHEGDVTGVEPSCFTATVQLWNIHTHWPGAHKNAGIMLVQAHGQ